MIIRASLVAIGLLTSLAFGQQDAQIIKTTIVTYALGGPPEGLKAFFQTGKEIKPFAAAGNGLSDPLHYEGPRRFIIRSTEEEFNAPPAGQQPKPPLAFVDLPERCDNVLIFAAIEGPKVRLVAYDVSTANLKGGDYRLFNFSHSVLTLSMQKQTVTVKPGEDQMVRDSSWHEKNLALPLKVWSLVDGKQVLQMQRYMEHYPERRNVMLMFDGIRKTDPFLFMNLTVEDPPKAAPEGKTAPQ